MGDSNVDNKVEAGAVQGGNFVQCSLNNPVFNIHTQGRTPFSQNYQRIRIIGRGTFGDVWLVKPKHVTSSEQFVVKEIPFCDQDVVSGKNEIEILKHCLHENIVQYIESFVEEGKILIVMEFCRGGDLMQLIKKQRPNNYFPERMVIDFFRCQKERLISTTRKFFTVTLNPATSSFHQNNTSKSVTSEFQTCRTTLYLWLALLSAQTST